MDEPLVTRWLHTPAMLRELECAGPGFDAAQIRADTARHMPRSLALGRAFFGHYIDTFHHGARRTALSSRHPVVP